MKGGELIYPDEDIADIENYIGKIGRNPCVFSKSTFDGYVKKAKMSLEQADNMKRRLLEYGYMVSDHDIDYIEKEALDKLNKEYTLERMIGEGKTQVQGRPLMVI